MSAERTEWKRPAEIRRAPERCRVAGCGVPMSPSGFPGTCGNHEIDKPATHPAPYTLDYRGAGCGGCNHPFRSEADAVRYASERGALSAVVWRGAPALGRASYYARPDCRSALREVPDPSADRPATRTASGHRCACVGCDSEPRGLCLGRLVE